MIDLGVERVLTSGGRATALDGIEMLANLVDRAGDKITVMAGGRLSTSNLETVIRQSRVSEVHLGSAASRTIESSMRTSTPRWLRDFVEPVWMTHASRQIVTLVQSIERLCASQIGEQVAHLLVAQVLEQTLGHHRLGAGAHRVDVGTGHGRHPYRRCRA